MMNATLMIPVFLLFTALAIPCNAQQKNPAAEEKRIESLVAILSVNKQKAQEIYQAMNYQDAAIREVFRDSSLSSGTRNEQLMRLFSLRRDKVYRLLTEEQQKKLNKLLDPEIAIQRLKREVLMEAQRERVKQKAIESRNQFGNPKPVRP